MAEHPDTAPAEDPLGMTPREIVAHLDQYIVGQTDAKKIVAIALRNRARRMQLGDEMREEVMPKNIIMIGPTGVGKTEIARRLSKMAGAPFVKVEASKYTEVGYVGRDVESMIRELADQAVALVRDEWIAEIDDVVDRRVRERLIEILERTPLPSKADVDAPPPRRRAAFVGSAAGEVVAVDPNAPVSAAGEDDDLPAWTTRPELEALLDSGRLEDFEIEIEIKRPAAAMMLGMPMQPGLEEMGVNLQEFINQIAPPRARKSRMAVAEAREAIREELIDTMLDQDQIKREAVARAEERGIVFIDEIDKVAGRGSTHGPDVSREGVQRDLLPIVEGTTVFTRHGHVRTDHILFIAAGAFHVSKPSDLIPELQGRFPLRVELGALTAQDFIRILNEPTNALTRQYQELMATEGVTIAFTPDGIEEIADSAFRVNAGTENIGARRLYTMMEKVLEEISFNAPAMRGQSVTIDRAFVKQRLGGIIQNEDLSKFIL